MQKKEEIWKDIPGYEGCYQVSNYGNIKSLSRNQWNGKVFHLSKDKILKKRFSSKKDKNGHIYQIVGLNKDNKNKTFLVHQLMAIVFLDHKNTSRSLVVDHIDEDKRNNYLSNLQIISNRENVNKGLKKLNLTSRYDGVSFKKSSLKWIALICIKGSKQFHIGSYNSELEAKKAYEIAFNNLDKYEENNQFRKLIKKLILIKNK